METIRVGASHVPPPGLDDIQPVAPLQATHPPRLDSTGQAMSARLDTHFTPHKEMQAGTREPVPSGSSTRNAEFDAIRDNRAERLQAANNTVTDMNKAETNAAKADRLFASVKTLMGGTPFAALTEAGNFAPSILQVGGVHPNSVREAAKENAVSSLYACVADVIANSSIAGLKPGYYLKPDSDTLHPSLQASIAEKLLASDKGPIRNALDAATEQLIGFGIRNGLMYGNSLLLAGIGKTGVDDILRPALKPVTAILVGMAIEHYHVSQDRQHHTAGPAMLYGRRDAVAEGQPFKPIDQDTEWLDEFNTLKDLSATTLTKMVSAKLGEGAAVGLKALISGEAFKDVLDPVSIAGGGLLTAGFAATGGAIAATANRAKADQLGALATAATTKAVGDVLNTVAFGLWAFGASLGASLPTKAAAAIDAHVPKAVERAADATGRVAVRGGKGLKDGAGYVTGKTISGGRQAAAGISSAIEASSAEMSRRINAMRTQPAPAGQGQPPAGQNIPLQPLAPAQASSSTPAPPPPQDAGDAV